MKVAVVFALCLAVASAGEVKIGFPKDDIEISLGGSRVIRGEDAKPWEAPFIISLSASITSYRHVCGGSLINPLWILTAAHCNNECNDMLAAAGLHHRDQHENEQQRITTICRVHENYGNGVGPYDIALLGVEEPFEINEFVQPANLPLHDQIFNGIATLYGWGQKKAYLLGVSEKMLQTMNATLLYHDECKPLLPEDAPLAVTNVCSSPMDNRRSACNGDSGGPLIKRLPDGSVIVVGVVSWGYIPCGKAGLPSVYTQVASHVDWINKTQSELSGPKF